MHRIALLFLTVATVLACGEETADNANTLSAGGPATAAGSMAPAQPIAGTGGNSPAAAGMGSSAAGSSSAGDAGKAAQPTAGATAGTGGTVAAGVGGSIAAGAGAGGAGGQSGASGMASGGAGGADGALAIAAGLHELFIHDACTGEYPAQPDTCLHEQEVEREITFGGETGRVYDVTLRVRGLFEPTTISGGQTPQSSHPYFKVGGTVAAQDYSHWHIEVSNPRQTYWLNHYPSTSHTIYKEDFEATLAIAAGAEVVVGVADGNDRQIDNAENGLPDRRQKIDGVTDEVLNGQMLRLDVVSVEAQQ
jgi:hypothetical protein